MLDYNEQRNHASLGNLTPCEYRQQAANSLILKYLHDGGANDPPAGLHFLCRAFSRSLSSSLAFLSPEAAALINQNSARRLSRSSSLLTKSL